MIEETGRVVAVEPGAVWVETIRRTTCQSCSANRGCGHALLDSGQAGARARVRALTDRPLEVGETVVMGLPEGALMRGAAFVYLLPLILMFAGALLGDGLELAGRHGAAIGGISGLLVGFLLNRWHADGHQEDQALHPRVLRTRAP